ncbi:MAG: DUF362 domain-containing protein [Candidatus Eisenbacteria bacterium]|nr:DUF362 domain-containing protein [Candidatus Eisenbacteria bacterium]
MKEPVVAVARSRGYTREEISDSLRYCLHPFGGMEKFVRHGDTVLVKPNLLSARNPDRGITTHPVIVRCLCAMVKEEGGVPVIGDSPAGAEKGIERLWRETGMLDVSREERVDLVNFESSGTVEMSVNGSKYYVAKPVINVDLVINVPKLKTHSLVLYTGALKNTFGILPGFQKSGFHKSQPSVTQFSQVLADVFSLVRPALTVMDAVVAMEGDGPASGKLRETGMLVASEDAVALDAVVSRLIGLSRKEMKILDMAERMGLGSANLDKIRIAGPQFRDLMIDGFSLPSNRTYRNLAPFAIRALGGLAWIRPVEDREKCTLCEICVSNCPVSAIRVKKKSLKFDYDKCIDCMCCHEICPENAVKLKKSFLGRFIW